MPTEAVVRAPALERPDLLAAPVTAALSALPALAPLVEVAQIDPELADTEARFEARFGKKDASK